jgi:excisionase family DNA binding protein
VSATQEISVREAARRTGRSAETIRRWIWSGRLPATKRGNTYYVDVMHLEGVAVEMGTSSIGPVPLDDLGAWLAEVDRWKSGRPGTAVSQTASDLVIEDRRARR